MAEKRKWPVSSVKHVRMREDGKLVYIEISVAPVLNENDAVVGLRGLGVISTREKPNQFDLINRIPVDVLRFNYSFL